MTTHRCTTTAGVALLLTLLMLLAGCGSDDGGGSEPAPNRPPTAAVVFDAGLAAVVEGEPVALSVDASDPDFDTLTYAWSIDPADGGSFDDPTAASVTWTPGTARGEVTLSCTVSDGSDQVTASSAAGSIVIGTAVAAGTLSADATWTAAASPYVVLGNVLVPVGVTLTLEAGTKVYMRPSLNLGVWTRPSLEVEGTFVANGTGSTSTGQVRIEGGRTVGGPTGGQHRGVVLDPGAQASLAYTRIREATTGLSQQSANLVVLDHVSLSDNGLGFAASEGAQAELVDCDIEDNGQGIAVSGSSVTVRSSSAPGTSRILDNLGAGLSVTSPSGQSSFVSVVGTSFGGNVGGHLRVDGSFTSSLSLEVTCSSLGSVPDDEPRVVVVDCPNVSLSLVGNYWGAAFPDPNGILALFSDANDCGSGVADWVQGEGDWYDQFGELADCMSDLMGR